ncbi:putative transmembrane protein [Rhodopirellula islandica]|uniref:Transmembrane protein n=1 Tax=Rhodopirellula islandica TaxID=595434 RepID=A0A0J1EA51_RHOIS|nr:DUF1553 domain-containing protein [Rhodopirellula islandica]KLU02364.1 putative transmembrane protein [Rhodopirellula islandica]
MQYSGQRPLRSTGNLMRLLSGLEWPTVVVAALLLACELPVAAGEPSVATRDQFEQHVRPMLLSSCIKCHDDNKQEGGLNLTTLEGLLRGGDTGPAIVPGNPDESLLLEALRYESFEMPPSGPLEDSMVEGIAAWVAAGADWPNGLQLKKISKIDEHDRDWWCFQPVGDPSVPEVDDKGWCRNEIDHFVFQRLAEDNVHPASEAERTKLARRVHFSLTGLPPDDETAWLLESEEGWYETLVEQLLDGSAYGENQARYWLDLVRYADSDGYNADHSRPEAHHYRDYVVRSFNEDKPYDRFVMEQLAGDEVDPGNKDALIGTMFLRHWIYEYNQRDVEGQWAQILNDVTETTADVFLAQGLKCARCHDHKFDPLLQRDYYALRSFFTPLLPREDQPIGDVETRAKHFEQQKVWEEATADIRQRLYEIERLVLLKKAGGQGFKMFTKELQSLAASRRHEITPYEYQIVSLMMRQLVLKPEELPKSLEEEQEAERQALLNQLAEFDHLKPEPLPTMKFVASDVGPVAPPTFIPDLNDDTPIEPAFPLVLEDEQPEIQPPHEALQSTGRRTALANWIACEDNPVTARVMVNRVWQQHFGRGLVENASDFGHLGTPPSHPELLDWLARRFMEDGWSLKKLHRLILTSATYRQSSERPMDDQLATLDPQNILLWRQNPRRLFGEEIHDCLMTASGEMGPGKRAIYKNVKRNALDPLLAVFDFPDRVESRGKRHRTTTSPQSLLMMNNPWMHDRSKNLLKNAGSMSLDSLVEEAYQRLYFRKPSPEELELASAFVESYEASVKIPEPPSLLASMPSGESAIQLNPKKPVSIQVPPIEELIDPDTTGDLTLEATVMLNSLYPDASVRTIITGWSGNNSQRGWSLGVTSTKSGYQPRNLILQLVGSRTDKDSKPEYEVIASNLRLELNRPYSIAVSIDLDDPSKEGITFYLKDLSKPDAEPEVAHVAHKARWKVQANRAIEIGGRSTHHRWDGLIQKVRLHQGALSQDDLFGEPRSSSQLLFDIGFTDVENLGQDQSGQQHHALVTDREMTSTSPAMQARIALMHALLCSNEVIYVD